MYNSRLASLYFNTSVYNNFIDLNTEWLFSKKTNLSTAIVSLNCSPKQYNQKVFLISLLLIEYLLKGPYLNIQNKKYNFIFIKTFVSKKSINIQYLLDDKSLFIFLDSFLTDIYWTIYTKNIKFKNIIKLDMYNLSSINYTINKLLDLTLFIKNKIKLERYLLRRLYSFNLIFPIENYLCYIWWIRIVGFYRFI